MSKREEFEEHHRSFFGNYFHHHRHHHHRPAEKVSLSMVGVVVNLEEMTMKVDLVWTFPSTRKDGSPLSPTDVKQQDVLRNGASIASLTTFILGPGGMKFSDTTPLTGADVYTVTTTTNDGLVSDPSNSVSITVPNANPAAAVTDLAGTLTNP